VTAPIAPAHSTENVVRGGLLALIAIPVGVILWVVIWSFGVVASIVAFVIALAAVWLYRRGSGGIITRTGAFVVTAIVIVTLALSFYFGLVVDYARAISDQTGLDPWAVFNNRIFWPSFNEDFGAMVQANTLNFLLALAFGVLGSFRVLRSAFRTARASDSPAVVFGTEPAAPAGPQLNPESTGTISSAPEDQQR
jgi:hypothetical protein